MHAEGEFDFLATLNKAFLYLICWRIDGLIHLGCQSELGTFINDSKEDSLKINYDA